MTTQSTRSMTSPTITIAMINSGLCVIGVSVVGISVALTPGVIVVVAGVDTLVVVGESDDVVVVESTMTSANN